MEGGRDRERERRQILICTSVQACDGRKWPVVDGDVDTRVGLSD